MQKIPQSAIDEFGEARAAQLSPAALLEYARLDARLVEIHSRARRPRDARNEVPAPEPEPAIETSAFGAEDLFNLLRQYVPSQGRPARGLLDTVLEYAPDKHPVSALIVSLFGLLPGKFPKTFAAFAPLLSRAIRRVVESPESAAETVARWISLAVTAVRAALALTRAPATA